MSELRAAKGRRIFYDVAGAGPALLLLTGRGGARTGWAPQVEAFAPYFRVVTIDNRDAGENDPEEQPYTMADLADDAAALLDALGIARAHAMGISMGGMIALQLALNHPARVERLVLVATTPGGWSPEALASFKEPPDPWIADPVERTRLSYAEIVGPASRALSAEEWAVLVERVRGNRLTKEGYLRQNGAIGTHDLRARLAEIAAPTLVIHGDRDPLVPPRNGEVLARDIPGARLLMLPGVGHLPPFERPEEVTRAVLAFLREETSTAGAISA